MNGPAALSAAADAVETERESGRRSSNGNAGVRQQKEKLVHSARNKTPACTTPRSEDFRTKPPEPLPRPRKPRPLVFLFWTVHGPFVSGLRAAASRRLASGTRLRAQSLFIRGIKTGAPAKSKILWGEEEGTEQSGVLAVRRGRSGRSFFRRHGGVQRTSHLHGCNLPRPKGEQKPVIRG